MWGDGVVWWTYPALLLVGIVGGALNVIAGGGSFLTLPLLIFLDLPAGVANGTNRVGVLAQNVAASFGFWRHGVVERALLPWAVGPALAGSVAGTWLALMIDDRTFERLLGVVLLVMAFLVLRQRRATTARPAEAIDRRVMVVGFVAAGVYGGFVQAGVGFLILLVTTRAGLDLVRGNAVKVVAILALTALSLIGFGVAGRIDWLLGAVLAVGMVIGGLLGVRATVLRGSVLVERVLFGALALFALKLLWR